MSAARYRTGFENRPCACEHDKTDEGQPERKQSTRAAHGADGRSGSTNTLRARSEFSRSGVYQRDKADFSIRSEFAAANASKFSNVRSDIRSAINDKKARVIVS